MEGDLGFGFGAELRRRRRQRGLSLASLARIVNYTKGHLSNVERGTRRPTADLAARCDDALEAAGQLIGLLCATPAGRGSGAEALRPQQLPAVWADLVGRRNELDALDSWLSDRTRVDGPMVVVLTGPAGIGKTTTALHWAHRALERFPDGALFADLHGFDVEQDNPDRVQAILDLFLRELGLDRSQIPEGLDARAALFRTTTNSRRLVVVLDNVASAGQVIPLLPNASGSAVLVASRRRLPSLGIRLNAHYLTLGPFAPDESLRLLRNVIGASPSAAMVSEARLREVAELCCHGPLALRIAAYRIASSPETSIPLILDQLRSEETRLSTLDTGEESTTFTNVISWSYGALSPATATLFRGLGAHPGTEFLAGAVAAMTETSLDSTQNALFELVQLHMVETITAERFAVHDLLRLYARHQLTVSDPPAVPRKVLDRAMAWYLATTRTADILLAPWQIRPTNTAVVGAQRFPDHRSALAWCDANLDILLNVSRVAASVHSPVAWQLPLALAGYFKLRRPRGVWIDMHHAGLLAARESGDRHAEGWVLNNLATAYYHVGEPEPAKRYFLEGAAVRADLGDLRGQAWCHLGLGYTLWHDGDVGSARSWFVDALPILEAARDARGEGLIHVGLAGVVDETAPDEARRELDRALDLFQTVDDPNGRGLSLHELGILELRTGNTDDAERHLRQALHVRHSSSDTAGCGETMRALAGLFAAIGQYDDAFRLEHEAAKLLREFQRPPHQMSTSGGGSSLVRTPERGRDRSQPNGALS